MFLKIVPIIIFQKYKIHIQFDRLQQTKENLVKGLISVIGNQRRIGKMNCLKFFDSKSNEQTKEKAEASIHDFKHNEEPMNPQFDKEK